MSQAIRPRVGREFVGESKCYVGVIVCDCVSVCLCWRLYVCLCVFCCSCKDHYRSASPLISGPGRWANVEGDLRCPRPSGPEWERSSRVSPSAM